MSLYPLDTLPTNMDSDLFPTHLTIFDDDIFNFEDESTSTEGSVPPSIVQDNDSNKQDTVAVKIKRKCGRPRNPIPRHKRVSHINAEHRRRGKIQTCFRTLKNMVPKKGEITAGRDSKSDILFKAIDYSKTVLSECKEQKFAIESLQQEIHQLQMDTQSYQAYLPDNTLFDNTFYTLDDRFEDYIQQRTRDNWKFWIFSFFIRPLFDSFKQSVLSTNMESFYYCVMDWVGVNILSCLRDGMSGVLRQISTETSIMTDPNYIPHEALTQTEANTYEQNCYDLTPSINPDPELGLLQICYTSL